MIETPDTIAVANLLAEAGLPREFHLTGLPGGGNNRVYRLNCGGSPLLLKAYFHHPDDPRDRLAAEFSFARFAWDHGLRCIPQPLARDDRNHLGLYEFIAGRALEAAEIGADAVDQAIGFFVGLNRHKLDPAARRCPTVPKPVSRLPSTWPASSAVSPGLQTSKAHRRWTARPPRGSATSSNPPGSACKGAFSARRPLRAWPSTRPFAKIDRCLSPSDFGFHNAILADDGRLRFIDFEYAGWDDPAKTVCDFLCQPKLPLPARVLPAGSRRPWFPGCRMRRRTKQRIALLLGVYRLKWCCIMLNEFLPVGGQRRNFAQDAGGQEERKRMQLEKAGQALERIDV